MLQRIRESPITQTLPVVMFTSSTQEEDVRNCYRLGANSYVQKPMKPEEFNFAVSQIGLYWTQVNQPTDRHLLFAPRHDFFSLDAGALRENCFCPIPSVAYSEIRPLCATLALVSGKRPALVQSSSRST